MSSCRRRWTGRRRSGASWGTAVSLASRFCRACHDGRWYYIGRDAAGGLRTVIGTSEANGYLRPAVRAAIQAGEEVAPGLGHAEQDILSYMLEHEISPLTVGAGRPICPIGAGEISSAGASAATPLK